MHATRGIPNRLMDLSGQWIDDTHRNCRLTTIVLDMGSAVSRTYGQQQSSALKRHIGYTCYRHLFLFNHDGDKERAMLRRRDKLTVKYSHVVLLRVFASYCDLKIAKFLRGDAEIAWPKLMKLLEAGSYRYAIRLKVNFVLEWHIADTLKRPVGRPSKKPRVFDHSFRYQAKASDRARRVVVTIEWRGSELFHGAGFAVTDLRRSPDG